ncbi:hypothetical protein [Streptomyces gardneri]|uniref:Gram-positive cocci surface proteins LPxTG domain-containing protein n=1 Tax=Streptomyces gardneri TaxID=66892 RepID=A0A4Y3RRD5_9ACTN|nr:hypothetical protein [Streptomyces gardneri]GEB60471.1 hypothetical protein SGA01_60760 [Streptomyces gardneri]GHH10910.1 hypothetical protein GCM10017674_55650 [Streptomyces gardneri]
MRTALRTAIATAVVAGVAITPALAAGAAFAADGPVAVKPAAATSVTATQAGTGEAAKAKAPTTKAPATTAPKTEAPKTEAPKTAPAAKVPAATTPATGIPKTEAPEADAAAGEGTGTYIRTMTLPNGAKAKIFKVGSLHFRAELYKQGQRVGTLDADGIAVAGNDDGTFLALFPNGDAHTWRGNHVPGARPGTYELANGSRVELVVQLGRKYLKAGGQVIAAVNGARQVTRYGNAVIVMEPDGGLAAYIPGSATQAAPRLLVTTGHVRTVKLANGAEAKIFKVADGHHRAELYQQGKRVGTLDADHWSVAANNNGAFFVLNSDGTSYDWVGNYLPGAKPGQYKLANGIRLELVKKDGRYGIQEIRLGVGTGVSYLKGDRQVFQFTGGGLVVLERDGGLAAYIPGAAKQSAPMPYTRDDACTIHTEVGIGAGTKAELTMSPNGPTATLRDIGSDKQVYTTLDRKHPSLPKSAGIIARIDNPFSATPTLYTKVEGGTAKGATHAFPKMLKGCTLNPVKGTSTPVTGTNGNTGTHGNTGVTVNTGGQTSVVPRGGVAAGAELGTESPANSTALYATGAGAASLAAAGLGFMVLRRRAADSRA